MHELQPNHSKLSASDAEKLLTKLNISQSQLPKIKINDSGLPENCSVSDVIKIDRIHDGKKVIYYRVVSV